MTTTPMTDASETTWNCAIFNEWDDAIVYIEKRENVFAGRRFYNRSPKPLKNYEKNIVSNPNNLQYRCNPQGRMRVRSLQDVTENPPKKMGLYPCYENLGCDDEKLKWVLYWMEGEGEGEGEDAEGFP